VLIAGGIGLGPNGAMTSAELFNPVVGGFTATSDLTTARCNHAATLLRNGLVLIAGGAGHSVLASAELY
jgi:hypothetical protein